MKTLKFALVGILGLTVAANAFADDTLSTVENGSAASVDPTSSFSSYGTMQTARGNVDSRLKALARALEYNPDRIYEHIRNHIEFTPTYGLSKGSVGALLDESGTAFDQVQLMVDLLRIDNPDIPGDQSTPAKYKVGTITLNATQFDEWFGVTNAKAACKMLADGGIPVKVNGASNCSSLTGNVSTVTMAHIWVEATTSSGVRYFDPARKKYDLIPGIGLSALKTAMGFTSSGFNSTASAATGATSGVNWASNVNYSGIENYLGARSSALISYLKTNYPEASLEEIIGGKKLSPVYGDDLGWASLPSEYSNISDGWHTTSDEVPDDYRTNVVIYVHGCGDGQTTGCNFTYNTFADQIAGKRIMLGSKQVGTSLSKEGQADVHLFIDGESVAVIPRALIQADPWCDTEQGGIGKFIPAGGAVDLTITLNMPYAANGGIYMDRIYDTIADMDEPAVLVIEFGDRRAGKGYNASIEQRREWIYPYSPASFYTQWDKINPATFPGSFLPRVGSDKQRTQIVKSYLDQYAQLQHLSDGLFSARTQHHYTIGIAWSRTQTADSHRGDAGGPPGSHPCQPQVTDAATSLDLVSGISVNALDGDDSKSKRLSHVIISGGAMLEGSVGEQATDSPLVLNTQSRFRWASQYSGGEKFYLITASNYSAATGLVADEAYAQPYTNAGYTVLLPASTDLGPGPTKGVKYWTGTGGGNNGTGNVFIYRPSNYRGGALVAFDAGTGSAAYMVQAGDGHISVNKWLKGGGATEEYDEFDPTKLPDVLEEDYGLRAGLVDGVSLANGQLTYQPAPDLVTGAGSFPYSLAFQRKFKAGQSRSRGLTHGWTHNWDMRASFGGDGMEALGVSTPQNAAAAISAMIASESILDATLGNTGDTARRLLALQIIENWQRTKMANNTVTLIQGNDTIQFFRLPDADNNDANDVFNPPAGQTGTLTQSGVRDFYVSGGNADCPVSTVAAGGTGVWGGANWSSLPIDNQVGSWWYGGVTLTYTSAMGDKQTYTHHTWHGTPYDAFNISAVNRCNTGHHATSWVFPQGVTLSFTYGNGNQGGERGRLLSVSNGLGRTLNFSYTGVASAEMSVTAGAGDARNVTIKPSETTRADGTKMQYEYSAPSAIFYNDTVDWSAARPMPWPQLTKVYAASDLVTPHLTIDYDEMWKVKSVTDKNNNVWGFHIAGSRGSIIDPTGAGTASYFDGKARQVRQVSPLGDITETDYNGIGLALEERQYFKGGVCANDNEYDTRTVTTYNTTWWQAASQTRHSAECKTATVQTSSTSYLPDYPLTAAETDAEGNTTTYQYVVKTGASASQTKLLSAIVGPSGERTEFSYAGASSFGRPTQKKVKISAAPDVWNVADYVFTNDKLVSRTIDPGGVNSVTSFTYDGIGNATKVTDPNGNDTSISYDVMRRTTKVARPLGATVQLVLDDDGKVIKTCNAVAASPADCATTSTGWAVTQYAYTPTFKVASVTDPQGFMTFYTYTNRDEVDEVTRIVDQITNETRIEKTIYDAAGQVTEIHRAVGTPLEQIYRRASYNGASGQLAWVEDAKQNRTGYSYDAFGRLEITCFPDKTAVNTPSTDDCEKSSYDKNGNQILKITRNGYPSGENISFVYDGSNRLTSRVVPDNGVNRTYAFTYDLAGRQTRASLDGYYQDFAFDLAGRLTSQTYRHSSTSTANYAPVSYAYDANGNRTKMTWPDGYYTSYAYDALNRTVKLCENISSAACATAAAPLASVAYDRQSQRTGLTLGNGTSAKYGYNLRGDLLCLDWNFAGAAPANCNSGAPEIDYDYAYNGVGQLIQHNVSDPLLYWAPLGNSADDYTANGLNQYALINATAITHEKNGNITLDHRGRSYQYDAENRLRKVYDAPGGTQMLSAAFWGSGDGMRWQQVDTTVTRLYYDGDQEIAETNNAAANNGRQLGANQIIRRYIRLPGSVDEPLLMISYNASGTETGRIWAHQNRIGSVIATTDAGGAILDRYTYSPYGESGPEGDTGFPFRFTGQKLYATLGLYDYKARWYDTEAGRFLQTDPLGYEDQMNLYAYVGNDPINLTDPTGMAIGGPQDRRQAFGPTKNRIAPGVIAVGFTYSRIITDNRGRKSVVQATIGGAIGFGDGKIGATLFSSAEYGLGLEKGAGAFLGVYDGEPENFEGAFSTTGGQGISGRFGGSVTVADGLSGVQFNVGAPGGSSTVGATKTFNSIGNAFQNTQNEVGATFSDQSVSYSANDDGDVTATISSAGSRITRDVTCTEDGCN